MRSQVIRNENCCGNNYVLSIIAEQATLSVQLLLASVHVYDVFELQRRFVVERSSSKKSSLIQYLKESLEDLAANVVVFVLVDVWNNFFIPIPD